MGRAPSKTATVVRAAMTLFTNGPNGMTGNDDLGTMSAWYVVSSLGLYPTTSGGNFLARPSPQFPTATVHIGQKALTVSAPGVTDVNRYVRSVALNGRGVSASWWSWDAVAAGGTLQLSVGASPSAWATKPADEPPSIDHASPDMRRHVDASIRGLSVDVLGQAPGTLSVAVSASGGWTVHPGVVLLRSNTLPVQQTVALTPPPGTPAGSYQVTVTVAAAGANTVTRTVTVTVGQP